MNSIAWCDGKGRPRVENPRVVVIKAEPERFWLLDWPIGVLVHWLNGNKRSFPHLTSNCPHCGKDGVSQPRQHFYCAALQYSKTLNSRGKRTWCRCVLSLSDQAEAELGVAHRVEMAISQAIIETWRDKDSRYTQHVKIAEYTSAPCADTGFPVEPILENMWKVQTFAPCHTEFMERPSKGNGNGN